jgi:hypothetical protein
MDIFVLHQVRSRQQEVAAPRDRSSTDGALI